MWYQLKCARLLDKFEFFMPIRASLRAACPAEVLHGPLMHFWGGLSASEVLINRADEVVADLL